MLEPVKIAFGQYLGQYFAGIVPTTRPLEGYVRRPLAQAVVWAPARMIDAAEEMLSMWLRADLTNATTTPPELPAIIVAMAKDYTPTGRDYTRQVADRQMVIIPHDPQQRMFGLRAAAGDVRAQIVIFAMDVPSAHSLAAQFLLFLDATDNRRFSAIHRFANLDMPWPVQIETPETPAMSIPSEAKNLTILAIDLVLRAQIPLFDAPRAGQPNDGRGNPLTGDPAGYPAVQTVGVVSAAVSGEDNRREAIRAYTVSAGQPGTPR